MAPAITYALPAMQLVCNLVMPDIPGLNNTITGLVPIQQTAKNQSEIFPDGYVAYPDIGVAYKVYGSATMQWIPARELCLKEGAYLAVIDTRLKFAYIMNQEPPKCGTIHVGIHGMSKNAVWVNANNGSVLLDLPWASDEPTGDGDIICASRPYNGLRNNVISHSAAYACELPIPKNYNVHGGLVAEVSAN